MADTTAIPTEALDEILAVLRTATQGDFSARIDIDVTGPPARLAREINHILEQNALFVRELQRIRTVVGQKGQIDQRASMPGANGDWAAAVESVNDLIVDLVHPVTEVERVIGAVAKGDLTQRIDLETNGARMQGEHLRTSKLVNTMVDQLSSFAGEVTRVAREVGTEGKLGGQAHVPGVAGTWKDLTDNVNSMADNLTAQVRNIAEVTTAVANGDLSKKITVQVQGEILELKKTINRMVDQLNAFASEVTRVAREVGTEGKLGGQAHVPGVSGVWEDLTDNVNSMGSNLTTQVRGIAQVVTAVAGGNLNQKLAVEAQGEIAALTETINDMIDTLATFAEQVTTVAREVGIEGKLGGQAEVPGASGTWRDLTNNVNRLAANLTTQVRAITEVTTAVAEGDLSKTITVEAAGEVADLKDNVNEMIRNLKETTSKNNEQDWLKTNLTKFTQLLQGQKDLLTVAKLILSELAPLVHVQHGVFYVADHGNGEEEPVLRLMASYAYQHRRGLTNTFHLGEGLVGQCALEKERIVITDVPTDYIHIGSGLGHAPPLNIIVLPVVFEGEIKAVIELATFRAFHDIHLSFLDQLTESIAIVLNTIEANMRTEHLLKQSQQLTHELQTQQQELTETNRRLEQQAESLQNSEELLKHQQEELQQTNRELQEKAQMLARQNQEVERKNREIDLARRAVEDKAKQLALTSKYKSEFLANMSHELRTPLNSMLILSKMLAEDKSGTLTAKQREFAQTVYAAGGDLLGLINEILDLSKIESGRMTVDVGPVRFADVTGELDKLFRQVAREKELAFHLETDGALPTTMRTDAKRLLQVLRNLLSNAFKFTPKGAVTLHVAPAPAAHVYDNEILNRADLVVAFSVRDTGVGIPPEKQQVIFEAFQQADGTTSRDFGGTGLGLSISRELARLLGGELHLESAVDEGSTFTLYLPLHYVPTSLAAPSGASGLTPDRALRPFLNGGDGTQALPAPPSAPRTEHGHGDASGHRAAPERTPPGGADSSEAPTPGSAALEDTASDGMASGAAALLDPPSGHASSDEQPEPRLTDDRATIEPTDRVLLIVEDDPHFAGILLEMARRKGFKAILTMNGDDALDLAHQFRPDAITLDVQLPGTHGLALLDQLKHDPSLRHIPVHILSVVDDLPRQHRRGAVTQLKKPVTAESVTEALADIHAFLDRSVRHLLVVEDNDAQRLSIVELLQGDDVHMTAVGTGAEALVALANGAFDCAVIDLGLPDMSGFALIEQIRAELKLDELPIVVYTGRDLDADEHARLHRVAEAIIAKDIDSLDRLLDETTLFLHRIEEQLPYEKQDRLRALHEPRASLSGRRALIVDDDIRNIFAITSLLEQQGMEVVYAENGAEGIALLEATDNLDVVLMDVMMPGMDGYEATRRIRKMPAFRSIPIIAVTAKAMKGDRERCIEAGATDYITKPVNVEQLLSLLRLWIDR